MVAFTQPHHEQILAVPRYLEIAFSTGDVDVECGFLEYLSRNLGRGRLDSYLEVCFGPGYHLNWLASRGVRAYGTSVSAEMVAYAEEKAAMAATAAAQAAGSGVAPAVPALSPRAPVVLLADPRDFSLPEAVDLAFAPRSSLRYLLRNDEVVAHLVAVAKNLGRGGLYVLEMDHPGTLLRPGRSGTREWTVQRDETTVRVRLGGGRDRLDPVTQLYDEEFLLEITENGATRQIRDSAPVRAFTHQEMRALVKLSGVFDWVATFGDLAITQPFDASPESRSMVPVLRCSV